MVRRSRIFRFCKRKFCPKGRSLFLKFLFVDFGLKLRLKFYTLYRLNLGFFANFQAQKIYLFDNHNHAYYFWHKSRFDLIISENWNILIHIDEHSDLRKPQKYLQKENLNSLNEIANYTNQVLNVMSSCKFSILGIFIPRIAFPPLPIVPNALRFHPGTPLCMIYQVVWSNVAKAQKWTIHVWFK